MSREYTLVHERLDQWISSPNNGGECCQTFSDTVGELNRLLARIKRLEEAGDAAVHEAAHGREEDALENWTKAKEAKP